MMAFNGRHNERILIPAMANPNPVSPMIRLDRNMAEAVMKITSIRFLPGVHGFPGITTWHPYG